MQDEGIESETAWAILDTATMFEMSRVGSIVSCRNEHSITHLEWGGDTE